MKFNAYVDGFNLYKGALQKRPDLKWLNLRSLCQSRWPEYELDKVYYFTSRIKERFPLDSSPRRQHAYLRALEGSDVQIVLGRFVKKIDWLRMTSSIHKETIFPELQDELGILQLAFNESSRRAFPDEVTSRVWKFSEKGSDVNLASFLLRDVLTNETDGAMVISADSDLATPIKIANLFGAKTRVILPAKRVPNSAISSVAMITEDLQEEWLREHQFNNRVMAINGKIISRPNSW